MLRQEIEEDAHAQRHMPALAHENGMHFLAVARIEFFQHGLQTARRDIGARALG